MSLRLNYREANPESFETMIKFESFMAKSGLDKKLYELIKIRASQINGCAFCLDMHTKDLRKLGETEQRVHLISVWRETNDLFTEEEKAVLELTEAVTLIANNGVPQELYEKVRTFFNEKQYVDIVMAINTINSWNRIAISTGMYPGCL
ncbi:carboxymuconolactone decarboxylase family protein [Neobacillus massiliamazoniensis]|uniref:Alkylhydroperoxidase AhpD core n=1 Tax=Neobacillus massiliamazoniensis TaxID=1499688 RepID=A0A0U1NUZ2_9BACI|nr:carboxymuconolactone decarboxylase family protein [Neobacillus massiliamazoniensis]CRK81785.1 alkylhydroperoxidase AhpD core [Neobacillus massiliamazoniensis]